MLNSPARTPREAIRRVQAASKVRKSSSLKSHVWVQQVRGLPPEALKLAAANAAAASRMIVEAATLPAPPEDSTMAWEPAQEPGATGVAQQQQVLPPLGETQPPAGAQPQRASGEQRAPGEVQVPGVAPASGGHATVLGKRSHHRAAAAEPLLPNLPAAFVETTASVGPNVPHPSKEGRTVPPAAVPVVRPRAGSVIIGDELVNLPNGEKPARPNKLLTVFEHNTAAEYSDANGYTKDGAPRPSAAAAPRRVLGTSRTLVHFRSAVLRLVPLRLGECVAAA